MTQPWFIAVKRFGPADGEAWVKYVEWSGLDQLEELVSLDMMLCPAVLDDFGDLLEPHIVSEKHYRHFFKDLEVLRREVVTAGISHARFLCVFRNPTELPTLPPELNSFQFLGFDLVEAETATSALCNCGGWPELDNAELSERGLLTDLGRALQLQDILPRNYPHEPHAKCDVWAIFAED